MLLGEDDVGGFWSDVGKQAKGAGLEIAKGGARGAAGYVGTQLAPKPGAVAPMPVKEGGIPTGLLIAGGVVVGVGVLALVMSGKGKSSSPRPTATNPRRRRRRRRGRR